MKKLAILSVCMLLGVARDACATWGNAYDREIDRALEHLMTKNKGNIVVYNANEKPTGATESGKKYAYLSDLSVSRTISPISSTLNPKESTVFKRIKDEGVKLQFTYYDLASNPGKTYDPKKIKTTKKTYIFNTDFIKNKILQVALKNTPGYWDLSTLGMAFYRTSATQSGNLNYIIIYDANGRRITTLNLERPADPDAAK